MTWMLSRKTLSLNGRRTYLKITLGKEELCFRYMTLRLYCELVNIIYYLEYLHIVIIGMYLVNLVRS